MKRKMLVIASMVAAAVTAATAQADLIAGWDFSQYFTAGRLSIDGTIGVNTLDANYSSLDPTLGAGGADSADKGTLYMDGTFGSSSVGTTVGNQTVIPTARRVGDYGNAVDSSGFSEIPVGDGAIQSNQAGGVTGFGDPGFNAFGVLRASGQTNTELLALLATVSNTLVFEADASSTGFGAQDWSVSFGGRSLNYDTTATVDVSFALDCSGFGSSTPLVVAETDDAYSVSFGTGVLTAAPTGCVKLVLGPGAAVDNVAVNAIPVPEPGAMVSLAAGVLTLVGLKRRMS